MLASDLNTIFKTKEALFHVCASAENKPYDHGVARVKCLNPAETSGYLSREEGEGQRHHKHLIAYTEHNDKYKKMIGVNEIKGGKGFESR